MIVVFVVDTSASMNQPLVNSSNSHNNNRSSLSRLDVAKQAVEELTKRIRKGTSEHNAVFAALQHHPQQQPQPQHYQPNPQQCQHLLRSNLIQIGQGPSLTRNDALLLLSTSPQRPDTASFCAAGGRLLVGFGPDVPLEGRLHSDPTTTTTLDPNHPTATTYPPCGSGAYPSHHSHLSTTTTSSPSPSFTPPTTHLPTHHHHLYDLEAFPRALKNLVAAKSDRTLSTTSIGTQERDETEKALHNKGQRKPQHGQEQEQEKQQQVVSRSSGGGDPTATTKNDEDREEDRSGGDGGAGGGIQGLNAALSAGLQLLSQYRLQHSSTENFGMGRLPNRGMMMMNCNNSNSREGNGGTPAALQSAVLILVTDGECLRRRSNSHTAGGGSGSNSGSGGGGLQLQFGSHPLKEFYQEPFRWDQRVFCLVVGDYVNEKGHFLHPQLRALCEVTGGSYWLIHTHRALSNTTDQIMKQLRPPMPMELPLPDPFKTTVGQEEEDSDTSSARTLMSWSVPSGLTFIHAGPVCCFQSWAAEDGRPAVKRRAMLLYTGSSATTTTTTTPVAATASSTTASTVHSSLVRLSQPLWPIPESHFPNRKLDTLPPRSSQPLLRLIKNPVVQLGGSSSNNNNSFEAETLIQLLHRLDHAIRVNTKLMHQLATSGPGTGSASTSASVGAPGVLLHRDVYVCEWLRPEGTSSISTPIHAHLFNTKQEYFPVACPGSGRGSSSSHNSVGGSSKEDDSHLSGIYIGILHCPLHCSTLGSSGTKAHVRIETTGTFSSVGNQTSSSSQLALATLTILPPEPHVLIPLLVRAAESEHRVLKKAIESSSARNHPFSVTTQSRPSHHHRWTGVVPLDEQWRAEFQAYMFRIPPYYHHCLKKNLKSILPANAHSLLNASEGNDSLPLQLRCFSKTCLQKIRNAEQVVRDTNEKLERQEAMLRDIILGHSNHDGLVNNKPLRYGQFDPRSSVGSYLAALRSMPPPWRAHGMSLRPDSGEKKKDSKSVTSTSKLNERDVHDDEPVDLLGALPVNCLMAYYESRRRWIFGGPSLTTRGLHVEGVSNEGSDSHFCGRTWSDRLECPLSLAGVGVSVMNETSVAKMGDYRERLIFSRSPVVGYGSNDAAGVAATTAADGSPVWSVDDDAMPLAFFEPKTGEFADSAQARVRSKLMVNFGNPFKDKRGNSLIPEKYYSQAPSVQRESIRSVVGSPRTPPGSPPNESFESVEEGEAVFVRTPSTLAPHKREKLDLAPLIRKRKRSGSVEEGDSEYSLHKNIPAEPKQPPAAPTSPSIESLSSSRSSSIPSPRAPPKPVVPFPSKPPPPPPPLPPTQKKIPPPPPRLPPPKPKIITTKLSQQSLDSSPMNKNGSMETSTSDASDDIFTIVTDAEASPVSGLSLGSKSSASSLASDHVVIKSSHPGHKADTHWPLSQLDAPQSPEQKPQVDLPSGWMCVWSKSQNRWYFFDTKSNQSVWKWPPG